MTLTPELTRIIAASVRAGVDDASAADIAGVSKSTLRRWLKRGTEERRGPFRALFVAHRKALAEIERDALATIRRGGEDWQAAAWLLERRFPERWGLNATQQDGI